MSEDATATRHLTAIARAVPGTLRQEVVVGGRHRLTTDEPESIGGGGTAASPHELLAAALASCVTATLLLYAGRKEWDLGEVSASVDYDHRSTPRRCEIAVSVTGDLPAEQLARLEEIAAKCPVRRSLEAGFEFVERVEPAGA